MILVIDKPAGITSHDVVNRVRRLTGEKRVGHAGTLDPFATGVLIIMVGRESTKQSDSLMGQDKEYLATLKLGFISDSHDKDGEIREVDTSMVPELSQIQDIIQRYLGEIEQLPPMHSAIKIKGQKLYHLARQGKEIERPKRLVRIDAIDVLSYRYPQLVIRVACGSGTYIRALARDIGEALGTGAYLEELRRTKSGQYIETEAIPLDKLPKYIASQAL